MRPRVGKNPVPGLRSPREEVEGLVYFGRMVDKLRLEQAGQLPAEIGRAHV